MRILLLLFLLVWICYSDAVGNRKEKEIISFDDSIFRNSVLRKMGYIGSTTEQDPNDPKYQNMAQELVRNHLRIKDEDIKSIKVLKVETSSLSGTITEISLQVFLLKGIPLNCSFTVWEKLGTHSKYVRYECSDWPKERMSGISSPSRPEQMRDPNNPKYKKLAETSIDSLFKTPGSKPFKKEDIKTIHVAVAKVQIGSKITNAIQFLVTTVHNKNFQCTSTISETPWSPEEKAKVSYVNCTLTNGNKLLSASSPSMVNQVVGGEEYKNPDDPEYEKLAKESFEKYKKKNKNVKVKNFKVTKVTTQLVAGYLIRIDFYVIPSDFQSFLCHSKIYKNLGRKDITVSCVIPPKIPLVFGGETAQNPDDPKYAKLAKESFAKYQKTHIGLIVKELKVTRVTSQVVNGEIYRIVFYAIPYDYHSLQCESKIIESGRGNNDISVKCAAQKKQGVVGGEIDQNPVEKNPLIAGGEGYENPDDPQYEKLAKESFEKYKKYHEEVKVKVKHFKVTKVTTQVVAGYLIRIDFYVIPTNFQSFPCHSKIYKDLGRKDITVSCVIPPEPNKVVGGQTVQNPDDPKYAKLAKEAFAKYQKKHIGLIVKELKVTRVTRQVVNGEIYRIVFYAITRDYHSLQCNSKIYEKFGNKDISVNCRVQKKLGMIGNEEYENIENPDKNNPSTDDKEHKLLLGFSPSNVNRGAVGVEEYLNPDDPEYLGMAKRSFERHITHENVKVKEFKVTKVTGNVITRIFKIIFYVIPYSYRSFQCRSTIQSKFWYEPIIITCDKVPKPSIVTRESYQNPDKPEYEHLAKQSLQQYYRETHKSFKVIKLKITKVVEQRLFGLGTKTLIDFYVIPTNNESFPCHYEISTKYGNLKVSCEEPRAPRLLSLPTKGLKKSAANEPYISLAEAAARKRIADISSKSNYITAEIISKIWTNSVASIQTRISKEDVTYVRLDVLTRDTFNEYNIYNCTVVFLTRQKRPANKPLSVECIKYYADVTKDRLNDPANKIYVTYAEKSLQQYIKKTHKHTDLAANNYDVIVLYVSNLDYGVRILTIAFIVQPINGPKFTCFSAVFQMSSEKVDSDKTRVLPAGCGPFMIL